LKKNTLVIVAVLMVTALLLTGCANKEERAVLSTVRRYVKLMNAEDTAEVYLMMHQKVRSIGSKDALTLQFALYDVKYTIEELSVEQIDGDYAYAPFVATMIKTDDSDFQNIRLTGKFALEKEGNEWKILGMAYEVENLDE
jgi:PBP1b-binding outer membrane lipoprotein LpoB